MAFVAQAGCGPGDLRCYAVTGRVTVGGQPAEGALVIFHPQSGSDDLMTLRPFGRVDASGNFTLNCRGTADGAPAGQYKVSIVWEIDNPKPNKKTPEKPKKPKPKNPATAAKPKPPKFDPETDVNVPDRLGGKYADPESSGLTATVTAGVNEIPPFSL